MEIKLTAKKLKTILDRTRIKDTGGKAAKYVLVDGLSCAEAGRRCGVSRAYIHKTVKRIKAELTDISGCPDGSRLITICVNEYQEAIIMEYLNSP